jgi:hypothetical protein
MRPAVTHFFLIPSVGYSSENVKYRYEDSALKDKAPYSLRDCVSNYCDMGVGNE